MAAPLLVQMEDDIDREIEKDRLAFEENERRVLIGQEESEMHWDDEQTQIEDIKPPNLIYGPQPQVITNDLLSLDEMVRDLVERCTCPSQFPMIKVSEGKYRIGDTKVLIFVRILRNHVMVRVGGGWDTLHHYLDKHDPCRCRSGHRSTLSAKIGFKNLNDGDRHLSSVSYERSSEGYPLSPVSPRRRLKVQRNSLDGVSSLRHRSHSPALRREHSPNFSSRSSSQNQSKEQQNGTCDSSFESNNEMSPRKINSHKISSSENRDTSNSQIQREDSYLSKKHAIPPNPSSMKNLSPSVRNGSSKNRSPSFENLTKKNRYKNSLDYGRKAWNAGPGVRSEVTRKNSTSDPFEGKISRSNSSVSDGGFEFMLQKEIPTRQSTRIGNSRVHAPMKSTKTAWNGRNQHNYSTLGSETVRPPKGAIRSARSASASPATTRKSYTSSAPTTPGNRSPKRHNLNPSILAPVLPPDILNELPNVNGDRDAEILAQLEGFVNNYRAYVLDKLASEGRSLPPDLAESEKENDDSSQKNKQYKSLKATPRKDGVGSRIPAPVF